VLLLRGLYRAYRGVKACISDELTGSRVSYYMRKASGYAKAGDYAGAMSAYISAEKVRRLSPEKAHLPLKLYYAYAFGNKSRGVKPKDLLDVPGLEKYLQPWMERAATLNDPDILFMLGTYLISKNYAAENIADLQEQARAIGLFKKVMEIAPDHALTREALELVEDQLSEIFDLTDGDSCILAAGLGHADSQYAVGLELMDQDEKQAMQWLLFAAEQGHVKAQVAYGQGCLMAGKDVEAFKWMQKAALQGDWTACIGLSGLYAGAMGKNIKTDVDKAEYWLKKARELGCDEEQYKKLLNMLHKIK